MLLDESLLTNPDTDAIIPYFEELINGDSADALKSIKLLADGGNLFASYVLGSFFLFGATPRFYDFNSSYEPGLVRRNARIEPNEPYGLSYLLRLLKIKEGDIPLYQLECIWDIYKIICGDTAFFKGNDLTCRPLDGQGPLGPLFKNGQSIKNLLVKLDHHEIFLDEAKSLLAAFEATGDNLLLDKGVTYLESILNEREIYKFSMHDICCANLMMARLYASGPGHMKKNMTEAVRHYEAARLDEGFVELIGLMKQHQGVRYQKIIKKYIGLIKDRTLKVKLYEENDLEVPTAPDVSGALRKLINTKPAANSELNFSFEFDADAGREGQVADSEAEATDSKPKFVESSLSEADVARIKERLKQDEVDASEPLNLLDDLDQDEATESTDDAPEDEAESGEPLDNEFMFVEEYPEYDQGEEDFDDD